MENILLMTDSYKCSHYLQYPPGSKYVYIYIESRGGIYDHTLFFGLQMNLKKYLTTPITMEDINEAESIIKMHGEPFNRAGWEYIVNYHAGFLPLEIRALPEGTLAPVGTPLMTIVNTDPNCAWLPGYFADTPLLRVWYPTTVATNDFMNKRLLKAAYDRSADDSSGLLFSLHDFGARGASSSETAQIGGVAHLVNFRGTDTLEALPAARKYYGADIAGFSIPAAEHSTITSWGRDREADALGNLLDQFGSEMVAGVSDSYDLWNAVDNIWGDKFKTKIENMGGRLVIRPDSGDPTTIPVDVLNRLGNKFGYTINSKGYKVLPPCIRVIQGDGLNAQTLPVLVSNVMGAGWSIENIAFGMGGALLQIVNRDNQRFAAKASAIYYDGKWHDVYKDPITDPGKRSKTGRFVVTRKEGKLVTEKFEDGNHADNLLGVTYINGTMNRFQTLDNVREIADSYL